MIRLALAYYIGAHVDLFQRLEIFPCSLTAVAFTPMGPRLLAYNDVGSLEHLKPKPEEPKPEAQGQPAEGAPAQAAAVDQPAAESATTQVAAADQAGTQETPPSNGVEAPAGSTSSSETV
jgi:probable phosphoglycerate mutase